MGRGRGRRRRQRRNGVNVYPYWNLPYDTIPTVEHVMTRTDGSVAVILIHGHGFNSIPGNGVRFWWRAYGSESHTSIAHISNRNDSSIEIRINFPGVSPGDIEILGIAYFNNRNELVLLTGPFSMAKRRKRFAQTPAATHPGDIPGFQYQPGYGSAMAGGPATTAMGPSRMERKLPPTRMLEPHRSVILHRQLGHSTGRRFGVPGFVPGQPGWAGNAGVAQSPHPTRGMRPAPGGAPMAVQTYGSLGYASMGDGSMDMAVRGARFAQSTSKTSKKKRRRKKRRRRKVR